MFRSIASVGAVKLGALIVTFFATLGTIRIITTGYGLEAYGAVSLVATIVAFMPIADLGLSIGLTNLTTRATALRSSAALRLSISTTMWILTIASTLTVIAGITIAVLGRWTDILGPAALLLGNPNSFMPWFMTLCAAWIITGPAYRILIGQQRVNAVVLLQAAGPVGSLALTAISAAMKAPLVAFAFFPLICSLLATIVGWILALRRVPLGFHRPVPPNRVRRTTYASVLRNGMSGLLFTLGGMLLLSFDRILLSQWGTPLALSIYATNISMYAAAQSGLGTLGSFLWPHYTRLRLSGALSGRTTVVHTIGFLGLGLLAGGAVWLFLPIYLHLAGVHETDPLMAPLIGIAVAFQAALLPSTSALSLPTQLRSQGVGLFGALILKITLCIWLIPALGAPGVILATICGVALVQTPTVAFLVCGLSRRHVDTPRLGASI